jgi:hypothetical protein
MNKDSLWERARGYRPGIKRGMFSHKRICIFAASRSDEDQPVRDMFYNHEYEYRELITPLSHEWIQQSLKLTTFNKSMPRKI